MKSKTLFWIILTIIIYTAVFTTISFHRHYTFHSGWDLGIFEDALRSTFEGNFFYNSDFEMNLLGNHFNLFYIIFSQPFYYLFPYTITILLIQSFILISGLIPLYKILRVKVESRFIQRAILITYAIFPVTWIINLEDFHPNIFAVPILIYVFYFIEIKDWKKYFISLAALLMVQEEISFIVIMLGIYLIIKKEKKIGLITILSGLIWIKLVILTIMPILNTTAKFFEGYFFLELKYGYLGNSIGEILRNIIFHPIYSLTYTGIQSKTVYILFYLKQFLFIPIFSVISILTIPVVMFNVFSVETFQACPVSHHSVYLIPLLFISVIFGIETLRRFLSKKVIKGIIVVFLAINIISAFLLGIMPWFVNEPIVNDIFFGGQNCFKNEYRLINSEKYHPVQKNAEEIRKLFSSIPKNASITTSQHTYPHLTNLRVTKSYNFKTDEFTTDYIFIDSTDAFQYLDSGMYIGEEYGLKAHGYIKIYEKDNMFLFEKLMVEK